MMNSDVNNSIFLEEAQTKLSELPIENIPDVANLPKGSHHTLYRANPLFVGRENELKELAACFKKGETAAIGQTAAATGLGGIGKTQLAVEFAHRYGQYFMGGVYWISMAEPKSVASEISRNCAQMIGVRPDFGNLKQDEQVEHIRGLWQSELPRLLIFDNCESSDLLGEWHPTTGGCRVLVTSRRQKWDEALGVYQLVLDTLTREQSVELLLKFRPDLCEQDEQITILYAIAEELGDLPLALHMAGSYLKTYKFHPLNDYLTELKQVSIDHSSMQEAAEKHKPTERELHVARTFAISTNRLDPNDRRDRLALSLLNRASYFMPGEPIPRELLLMSIRPEEERERASETNNESDALRRLMELGLINERVDGAVVVHRLLVYFVHGLEIDDEAQKDVEEAVLTEATRLNGERVPTSLLVWQFHLRYVTDKAFLVRHERSICLCISFGDHLEMIGVYKEAKLYYTDALFCSKDILDDLNPLTAVCFNNLGNLHRAMGEYNEAENFLKQGLSIRLNVCGKMHPETAGSYNSLGFLFDVMGEYEVAKSYHKQALSIYKEALGEKHIETVVSLNNLGESYKALKKYEKARLCYQESLLICQSNWGEMHPYTAGGFNNLGSLFFVMGDIEEAKQHLERALSIYKEVFGEMHPDTAQAINNLGTLYMQLEDYEKAKPYLNQAISIKLKLLGKMHPDTAISFNNLGRLLTAMGEYEKAEFYLERALSIYKEILGEMHPDTAICLRNFGELLSSMGKYEEAQSRYKEALNILETRLGKQHKNTQRVRKKIEEARKR